MVEKSLENGNSSPICWNSWKLSLKSNIHSSLPVDNDRNWLERHEHSPKKVVISASGDTVISMAKSHQLTISAGLIPDAQSGIRFQEASHIIKVQQPITCLAYGLSQHVSLGHRFTSQAKETNTLIPIVLTGHSNGEIQIWHAKTSSLITRLISHSASVTEIIVSPPSFPHQTQILSVSADRKVFLTFAYIFLLSY